MSAANFQISGRSDHFVPIFKQKFYDDLNLSQFLKKSILQDILLSSFQKNNIDLIVDEIKFIDTEEKENNKI
jgi:hypothetical protein